MTKIKETGLEKNALYFIPLGGSEQFGVNLNVYVSQGQYLVVDCGIGFADEHFPGIDLLLPDPVYLERNQKNIQALIITHAHEDHVGAVAHLWPRLKCPIYTTEFTAIVLRRKLGEAGLGDVPVHVIKPLKDIAIGVFNLRFLPVAHSIPDACALLIGTPQGRVLHSGDWNLDPRPVIGKPTDSALFKRAGDEGVIAYIGDSTNAAVPGRAGSESDVETGLEKEFKACKGRIAVTVFSSNIGRVRSIARAAGKAGRNVGVVGRSLHQMIGAARDCGYLDGIADFVPEDELGYLPEERTVIIATGSQGEYRSALAKISRGEFNGVRLARGDTVIFSARAIPGNEKSINAVCNNLVAGGIRVVTPDDTDNVIHVSGHPCRDEIAEMYQWLRPQTVIPVHGERTQLNAQADFARFCQIKNVIVPNNGSVIRLAPGTPEIIDHVETGLLAVDQKRVISANHISIAERRKLQFSGSLHVSLVLDARGELVADPKLATVGLIDREDKAEIQIENNLYEEVLGLLEEMSWEERLDDEFVTEEIRIGLRRFMLHILGIKPKTTVHVIRI
jgi:ribonuclease J